MTEMQTEDQSVTDYGSNRSGVNTTTQTVADPATGASVRRSRTAVWSGKSPGVEFVWLIAGIVVAFLALDFIFHASGANNVGFAAFVEVDRLAGDAGGEGQFRLDRGAAIADRAAGTVSGDRRDDAG